ncbi:hypothetical protein NQ314_016537 [Rhamnusium bicolor]|uniref:DDE Tnp4 domain-containing protein n=1 Tax=Rhamnusium bicolor TaxID=1586634 RepID=A0AAV8WWH8_9CUCU|nr:hypothetical protein NQ314_016537 [Rhamnusium bicolor]
MIRKKRYRASEGEFTKENEVDAEIVENEVDTEIVDHEADDDPWVDVDADPAIFVFDQPTGLTINLPENVSPGEVLAHIFDNLLIDKIGEWVNTRAEVIIQNQGDEFIRNSKNRKENPKKIIATKLKRRERVFSRKGKIMVLKWKDKRDVLMISTKHSAVFKDTTNRRGMVKTKPEVVIHYNTNMSGTDRTNQMVTYYSTPRKTLRCIDTDTITPPNQRLPVPSTPPRINRERKFRSYSGFKYDSSPLSHYSNRGNAKRCRVSLPKPDLLDNSVEILFPSPMVGRRLSFSGPPKDFDNFDEDNELAAFSEDDDDTVADRNYEPQDEELISYEDDSGKYSSCYTESHCSVSLMDKYLKSFPKQLSSRGKLTAIPDSEVGEGTSYQVSPNYYTSEAGAGISYQICENDYASDDSEILKSTYTLFRDDESNYNNSVLNVPNSPLINSTDDDADADSIYNATFDSTEGIEHPSSDEFEELTEGQRELNTPTPDQVQQNLNLHDRPITPISIAHSINDEDPTVSISILDDAVNTKRNQIHIKTVHLNPAEPKVIKRGQKTIIEAEVQTESIEEDLFKLLRDFTTTDREYYIFTEQENTYKKLCEIYINVYTGEVGFLHDYTLYRRSELYLAIQTQQIRFFDGTHLVGDLAYKLHTNLMVGFKDNGHLTLRQKNFNVILSKIRVKIENAFALLKGKFRR